MAWGESARLLRRGVTECSGIRATSQAILVVMSHVRVAMIQTTFTVAAAPLLGSSEVKAGGVMTPHGPGAARFQGREGGKALTYPPGSPAPLKVFSSPPLQTASLQNDLPPLRSQILPRDGNAPEAEKSPSCGLDRTLLCRGGLEPGGSKVGPNVRTDERGPGSTLSLDHRHRLPPLLQDPNAMLRVSPPRPWELWVFSSSEQPLWECECPPNLRPPGATDSAQSHRRTQGHRWG